MAIVAVFGRLSSDSWRDEVLFCYCIQCSMLWLGDVGANLNFGLTTSQKLASDFLTFVDQLSDLGKRVAHERLAANDI